MNSFYAMGAGMGVVFLLIGVGMIVYLKRSGKYYK